MPQSLSQLLIHAVFSTRHRQPSITASIEPELYAYIAKLLYDECYCPALSIGGTEDHIHILYAQSRTWSVADVIELVKKRTSKWIKTKGPEFRAFYWQTGYGAFSVGRLHADRVKEYIQNQKEHHKKYTYKDEFLIFLKKHNIEYDERYVWD